MKIFCVIQEIASKHMNMKLMNTNKTTNKSDGFISFQHFYFGVHELLMSLKTWASREVTWASKI